MKYNNLVSLAGRKLVVTGKDNVYNFSDLIKDVSAQFTERYNPRRWVVNNVYIGTRCVWKWRRELTRGLDGFFNSYIHIVDNELVVFIVRKNTLGEYSIFNVYFINDLICEIKTDQSRVTDLINHLSEEFDCSIVSEDSEQSPQYSANVFQIRKPQYEIEREQQREFGLKMIEQEKIAQSQ